MEHLSPSRWMAPLALLAAIVAVGIVVSTSTGGDGQDGPAAATTATGQEQGGSGGGETSTGEGRTGTTATNERPRTYRVQAGDSFATIAEETGLSVEELQELNPDVDPQSLRVGQSIRLAE
jgi:LysM repeat protein